MGGVFVFIVVKLNELGILGLIRLVRRVYH